ncbi:hypothetical protein BDY17DRAFT_289315 [Neohortaea acidophila]|uniref:Uncharacterized protein n=1 Tax=Neohortaea acidophila TaxID=245834 RepID=A0A6A6Q5G7_9PEZI|nr:uncharacterized protein BDY17DRAFT_289315 [Neohortaea acidophila]KAF2487630.1 hypothetical protein BDY17DRAFT_289315 [Neohortaea acidophila]
MHNQQKLIIDGNATQPEFQVPASRKPSFNTVLLLFIFISILALNLQKYLSYREARRTRIVTTRLLRLADQTHALMGRVLVRLNAFYGWELWAPPPDRETVVRFDASVDEQREEEGGGGEPEAGDVPPPPYFDDDDAWPAVQEAASAGPESDDLLGSRASDGEEAPALQQSV